MNKDTFSYIERGLFGIHTGIPRLLKLFDELDIKTTWFFPGMVAINHPGALKDVYEKGHEIGYHGMSHTDPTQMSAAQFGADLEQGIDVIKRLIGDGQPISGYRSPAWDLSAGHIRELEKKGFIYDSSLMGNDHGLYWVVEKTIDENGN